jgi:uroporphyrinogen-III decarboxylase
MSGNPTPRQMVQALLQGISPPRPLFLPIVFSLGARLQNLSLRNFLHDPTKISNSLRQVRGHLRSDGVACYFDPHLEAEALGGTLRWDSQDTVSTVHWPADADKGELPGCLRSPEEAMKSGRISVAVEVIRRLKLLLRDDALLTAGVAGPFTLAARITQLESEASWRCEDLPDAALDLAASLMTHVSAAFVQAGADVIFIQEKILPRLAADSCAAWASRVEPAVNIIRFYQALPVLHFSDTCSFAENIEIIFQQHWDCVVCPTIDWTFPPAAKLSQAQGLLLGVALPPSALTATDQGEKHTEEFLHYVMSELRPAVLTTAGDVPMGTDIKRLIRVSEGVRQEV